MEQLSLNKPTWVNFALQSCQDITSSPQYILEASLNQRVIDSFIVTNTSAYSLLADIKVKRLTVEGTDSYFYLTRQEPLDPFDRIDLLKGSCLYLQPGDEIIAYTNFLDGKMDCLISYRDINSPLMSYLPLISLTQDKDSLVVTAKTSTSHNLKVAQAFSISGTRSDGYSGIYQATSIPDNNTFTYILPSALDYPATGYRLLTYSNQ